MFTFTSHLKITYSQLLLYGVHVGHSFANSILFAAWLVYARTKNILIINLYKTLLMWKLGFRCISKACWQRSPVWFLNLDTSFSGIVQYSSSLCGEFYWTTKWLHGFISNYTTFIHVFNRLRNYSSEAYKGRQKWVVENAYHESWQGDHDHVVRLFLVYLIVIDLFAKLYLLVFLVLVLLILIPYVILLQCRYPVMMNQWIVKFFIW